MKGGGVAARGGEGVRGGDHDAAGGYEGVRDAGEGVTGGEFCTEYLLARAGGVPEIVSTGLVVFVGLAEGLRISGTGISRAPARAVTMEAALGKRSAGSFARLRMITSDRASEISGLIRVGEGGIV